MTEFNLRNFFENNSEMAKLQINIDPLKYLERIPQFSGDYKDLENFVNLIEKVQPVLNKYDELGQSIFFDIIKSRLVGRAREIIEINSHIENWKEIKDLLINNFGDHSTLEELFDRLRGVTFKTNAIEFYSEIKISLRRLNVKTKLLLGIHDSVNTIKANKLSALNIFKNKVPEPLRSILYCRNPTDLEKAMEILYEAGYAHTTINNQNSHQKNFNKYKIDDKSHKFPYNKIDFNNRNNSQKIYTQTTPHNSYNRFNHNNGNKFNNTNNNRYNNNNNRYNQFSNTNNNNKYQQRNFNPNPSNNFNNRNNYGNYVNPNENFKNPYNGNNNNNYNRQNNNPEPMEIDLASRLAQPDRQNNQNEISENFRREASEIPNYPI